MDKVVIVGAGGFGREVFNYVEDSIRCGSIWRIKGFIDDSPHALDGYDYPRKIISSIDSYVPEHDDVCIVAVGIPKARKAVVERLRARGARFASFIHPTAQIGRNVRMGTGCVMCPETRLTCDISVGDFAIFNASSGAGHDAEIGSYATISAFCDITGHCKVGEGAFLASSVSMRPSSKVGAWASVGIGSCVIMNIKDGESAHGTPAVIVK